MAITPLIPGFKIANGAAKPRLIISIEGQEKQGKTNFAFTAPGPIAYMPWDVGDEGVIEKFQTKKQIFVPDDAYATTFTGDKKKGATEEIARFKKDYQGALVKARSTVVDTGSELWEVLRLARLGKLTQVMPHHYVEVNSEFRDLIRLAFEGTSNLILLHKSKPEWKNGADGKGNKTGRFERAGFSEIGFLVQINLLAYRLPPEECAEGDLGFRMLIKDCRHNPEIAGMILENEMCDFATLAAFAMPDLDASNWE